MCINKPLSDFSSLANNKCHGVVFRCPRSPAQRHCSPSCAARRKRGCNKQEEEALLGRQSQRRRRRRRRQSHRRLMLATPLAPLPSDQHPSDRGGTTTKTKTEVRPEQRPLQLRAGAGGGTPMKATTKQQLRLLHLRQDHEPAALPRPRHLCPLPSAQWPRPRRSRR